MLSDAIVTILVSPHRERLGEFIGKLEPEDVELALIVMPAMLSGMAGSASARGHVSISRSDAALGEVARRFAVQGIDRGAAPGWPDQSVDRLGGGESEPGFLSRLVRFLIRRLLGKDGESGKA